MIKFNLSKYLNKTFGCLSVVKYAYYDKEKKLNYVEVKCNKCGNIFNISTNRLNTKKHSYCIKCPNKKEKITLNKRIRRIYSNMKSRCYNSKTNRYYIYGAKGIKVCDEWKNNYKSFEKWALENGYKENLTLDRIDNNGNYEPSNCRWVDYKTQSLNTSTNRKVEINGEIKCITEWCEYYNIPYYVINNRINKYKWEIHKAFTTPVKKIKRKNNSK